MKVLLLWESSPEVTDLYLIEDPIEEELAILEAASGRYINTYSENDAVFKLSDMLASQDDYCAQPGADHNCRWAKLEKQKTPFRGQFDMFVQAGCIL